MKQYFAEYHYWEDYKNGMYLMPQKSEVPKLTRLAKQLLSDAESFLNVCELVIDQWPVSTAVNLTNKSNNRRAWLGQSSCCYQYGISELVTRIAWGELSEEEREKANWVADKIIIVYEKQWKRRLNLLSKSGSGAVTPMEYQMRLPLVWRN